MAEQVDDRRVRRTKKQLRQGLTQLMAQKSIKEISVRELSELVDMNRSTFYAHYKDIFDLLESIENEMTKDFITALSKHAYEKHSEPLSVMIEIFKLLAEYSDLCTVLLGKNGDLAFVNRLKAIVREKFLHDWSIKSSDIETFDYYYAFVVSGVIGLFQSWLEKGMEETPQQMALLSEQMIRRGIKVLE